MYTVGKAQGVFPDGNVVWKGFDQGFLLVSAGAYPIQAGLPTNAPNHKKRLHVISPKGIGNEGIGGSEVGEFGGIGAVGSDFKKIVGYIISAIGALGIGDPLAVG